MLIRFPPKIHFNNALKCAKFQKYALRFVLVKILQSVQKEVKLRRKNCKTLTARILEMARRFPSNLVCGLPYLVENFTVKLVPIG